MTGYQLVYWPGLIRPEDRDNRTLNAGAVFLSPNEAMLLRRHVLANGGQIRGFYKVENPTTWWASMSEYLNAGLLTADALHAIGQRGAANHKERAIL